MSKDVAKKIKSILGIAFPNTSIPENVIDLHIGACEEWDSLGNYALLMLVEQEFGIEFTINELSEIKSVKQIIARLESD